ncbi:hypothetical protein IFM89_002850 [Coptis chinensis]|uniref:Pentatricopeptide repeat-containing protein n=1 Tax=Coptis chinensis TaxID=261450 RepID=A0A835H2U4_9MAGN|nr:hypothetical protein IFM89_002850 [Coptis chinensis]
MIQNGLFPDYFTFPSLFKSSCGNLSVGKQLHSHCVKFGLSLDSYIHNTLMYMYSNCGSLVSASTLFDQMVEKTVVFWATMIGANAQWGSASEAVELFQRMEYESVKPNDL